MKYTIIIAHYNQINYIEEMIKSITSQTYNNIEIIVADDCSPQFDYKKIEKIIKKHNKKKFEYKILTNKKNLGTTKNLNNALKHATGDLIHLIAADDALYDRYVVSKIVKEFENKDINVLTGQSIMCGHELTDEVEKYVNARKAKKNNKLGVNYLYYMMAQYCIYGAGATIYRRSVFDKYGFFNEKYKYVEDWSYYLHLLLNKEMIYYADIKIFKHRDGGISHSEYSPSTLPEHVRGYYYDIMHIYENEVIDKIKDYSIHKQYKILKRFQDMIYLYGKADRGIYDYMKHIYNAKRENKKLRWYWKFQTALDLFVFDFFKKFKNMFKYNKVVPITFVLWIIICLVFNNNINITNNNILFSYYLLIYLITYLVIFIIDKIIYFMKVVRRNLKR